VERFAMLCALALRFTWAAFMPELAIERADNMPGF
jgi:hypothetical protein